MTDAHDHSGSAHSANQPNDAAHYLFRLHESEPAGSGALARVMHERRDLDTNVIDLPPDDQIETFMGPGVDILWVVLAGRGTMETGTDSIDLAPGDVLWLPRHTPRGVRASSEGLTYVTTHIRKPGLSIGRRPEQGP